MSTIKQYMQEAIAARKTKKEVGRELRLNPQEVKQLAEEYGLHWPIFRKPQPLSGVCALEAGRLTYRGESMTVRELWERYGATNGLSLSVVQKRISNCYTPHDAVTIPKGKHRCIQS